MPAGLAALLETLRLRWRQARDAARLAIGIGNYEAYAAHMRAHHPDRPPMDRQAYFRDRQAARYGRGRSRCC